MERSSWTLPLLLEVAEAGQGTIFVRTQRPFRLSRLFVDPACAQHFDILEARAGTDRLFDCPVPAALFSSVPDGQPDNPDDATEERVGFGFPLRPVAIQPGIDVCLVVRNRMQHFSATLKGCFVGEVLV